MRTIRTKVYKFDELSKESKKVAIDNFRDNETFDFIFEDAWESLKLFSDRFDIKIRDFNFLESYRSHYSFEMKDEILELSGLRLRTYLLNNFYYLLYERKPYGEYKKRDNGKWRYDRYSKCQYQENSCPFTDVCYDEDLLYPIKQFIACPNRNDFKDLLEDCLSQICKSVEDEIKGNSEDAAIIETIQANDYEFYANGKML